MDHWKVVLLLERAAQALVLTDEQGRWLWVNQATVELLGHSHATLVGSNGSDLLPDWPVQSNATLIQTVYRRPDGVQRHLWIERLLLALEYPYRLFAIYVLPPRHTCSTQTCTEGLYYRTLFDLLPVGVAIADATGRIVAANPASELILGVELPVILRSRLDDPGLCSLPAEERPVVQAWKNRQIITNRLISFTRPDGCERWISVNAAPLPNGGVITAYVDVTEQEQTKIALRQNQEKFQRIADMFPGVIYTVIEDENGPQTYEYLSPGFERIHEL
ncbi:MAG: PAS domain-containing protein, partial [Gloeomargarita sp. SKYG98]|nr:PAS domain-containing protein [Gloeomargarita sp. SKYG98]